MSAIAGVVIVGSIYLLVSGYLAIRMHRQNEQEYALVIVMLMLIAAVILGLLIGALHEQRLP